MRPTLDPKKKKRVGSISMKPLNWQILSALAADRKVSRSAMVESLVAKAGLDLGIQGGSEPHISAPESLKVHGKYVDDWGIDRHGWHETETLACNPYTLKGRCQNPVCQAAYKKEGVV